MINNQLGLKNKIVVSLAVFCTFLLVIQFAVLSFYTITPMTFWLEYHSVEPKEKIVKTNTDIWFRSHYFARKGVRVKYNDVLFKRDGYAASGRWDFHKDQNDEFYFSGTHKAYDNNGLPIYSYWDFDGGVHVPGEYKLVSNITVLLPLGIKKTQTIESSTFIVR